MRLEEFEFQFKKLTSFFNKKPSPEQISIWYDKVKFCFAEDFSEGINEVISNLRQFPTINEVLNSTDKAKRGRSQIRLGIDRIESSNFISNKNIFPGNAVGKSCMKLIQTALNKKNSGMEVALGMLDLELEFPDIGFKQCGTQLMDWCEEFRNKPSFSDRNKLPEEEVIALPSQQELPVQKLNNNMNFEDIPTF